MRVPSPPPRSPASLLLGAALGAALLAAACAQRASLAPEAEPPRASPGDAYRPSDPVPGEDRAGPRAGGQAESYGPLGRGELVRRALDSSPGLAAARFRSARARAAVAAAGSALRPSLRLELEGLRADAPSLFLFKHIDARELPPDTDFNRPGTFGSLQAGLEARQLLWSGGRIRARLDRARAGEQASEHELAAARADLVEAVLDGYHAVLAAGEAIAVAERSVEVVEAQLARVASEAELGRALRSDVLSLEVRLAEAREARLSALTARDLAAAGLLDAVGLPPAAELALEPEGAPPPGVEGPAPGPDEAELLRRALLRRPELEAARQRAREAELAVREARAAWMPRAELFGRVYRVDDGLDLVDADDAWAVGVVLGWDLYAGGRRDAELEGARAAALEARALERRVRQAIELDVRAAALRLRSARGRFETSRSAAELAEENLALVLAQYEGGRVPITRLLEAEAALLGARLRRIEAHHDLARARIRIARADGSLLEPGGSSTP